MSVSSSGVYTPTSAYGAFCTAAGLRFQPCNASSSSTHRWVEHGPQDVERRAHAKRLADRRNVLPSNRRVSGRERMQQP